MTLEETVIAVREYSDKCRDKNLENYTSNGIEIDPHTLVWAEYWLTKMFNKENQLETQENTAESGREITFSISDVAYDCIKLEADRKQISLEDLIGIIINAWCVQQFVMHIRTGGE